MNAKSFLFVAIIVALIGGAILVFSQPSAAPQVRFVTLQGEQVTMDSLRGKVVLVNFWATSCPGCIKEMPALVKVYNKYHEQGLEIIAVAMNYDPPNYVLNYTKNHALPFKVALPAFINCISPAVHNLYHLKLTDAIIGAAGP